MGNQRDHLLPGVRLSAPVGADRYRIVVVPEEVQVRIRGRTVEMKTLVEACGGAALYSAVWQKREFETEKLVSGHTIMSLAGCMKKRCDYQLGHFFICLM